jgi:hypothetical protein
LFLLLCKVGGLLPSWVPIISILRSPPYNVGALSNLKEVWLTLTGTELSSLAVFVRATTVLVFFLWSYSFVSLRRTLFKLF